MTRDAAESSHKTRLFSPISLAPPVRPSLHGCLTWATRHDEALRQGSRDGRPVGAPADRLRLAWLTGTVVLHQNSWPTKKWRTLDLGQVLDLVVRYY